MHVSSLHCSLERMPQVPLRDTPRQGYTVACRLCSSTQGQLMDAHICNDKAHPATCTVPPGFQPWQTWLALKTWMVVDLNRGTARCEHS